MAAEAPSKAECKKRLEWFQQLNYEGEHPPLPGMTDEDPQFPAALASITSIGGAECGDAAAGIEEPCAMYNTWNTFQDIAAERGMSFIVIPPEGIEYNDINQGALGDCYFLSALASLAHSKPKLINDMFVQRELWDKDVYTSKWNLNGRDILVSVNNDIPYDKDRSSAWFAQPTVEGKSLVFWPCILEKAWSKIFHTFKATEGGVWMNVVASITSATVQTVTHRGSKKDDLWALLVRGTSKKFPMGAGSGKHAAKYGLVSSHAFAVFKAFEMENGVKAITCYNPWGSDLYNGLLPNPDKKDGMFNMTLDEYADAFEDTQVADVLDDYVTKSSPVSSGSDIIIGVKEFEITTSSPFFVSVNWPADHLFEPCKVTDPDVVLAIAKQGTLDQPTLGNSTGRKFGVNSDSAMLTGPGHYIAYVAAHFKKDVYIHTVSFSVYSADQVVISESTASPKDTIKAMVEPACDTITMTGDNPLFEGVFKRDTTTLLHGIPTFRSTDRKTIAYFKPYCQGWTFIPATHWHSVVKGVHYVTTCYKSADLGVCGAHDSKAIGGFAGVSCADAVANKFGNIACTGVGLAGHIQRYCPESCAALAKKEAAAKDNPDTVSPSCDAITIAGKGTWHDGLFTRRRDVLLGSVPTFWSSDGATVAYYKPQCQGWTFIGANQWPRVQAGDNFPTACMKAKDLGECGCVDAKLIGPYLPQVVGCDLVAAKTYSNLQCDHGIIERFCPKTCGAAACNAASTRLYEVPRQIPAIRGRASAGGLVAAALLASAVLAAGVSLRRRLRGQSSKDDPQLSAPIAVDADPAEWDC